MAETGDDPSPKSKPGLEFTGSSGRREHMYYPDLPCWCGGQPAFGVPHSAAPASETARCLLCDPPEVMPSGRLLGHLRNLHPDAYGEGPERWPDGGLVVEAEAIEPEDFTDD